MPPASRSSVWATSRKSATATVAGLTNVGFTLAKLVPGTSSIVGSARSMPNPASGSATTSFAPPTVAEQTAVAGDIVVQRRHRAAGATWCGTYPATDTQGTLVDNGDGSYEYTFYRDLKQAAAIVASLNDTANGLNKKADLGDVSYDASLTHRLGIQIGGAAPGTGTNTTRHAVHQCRAYRQREHGQHGEHRVRLRARRWRGHLHAQHRQARILQRLPRRARCWPTAAARIPTTA